MRRKSMGHGSPSVQIFGAVLIVVALATFCVEGDVCFVAPVAAGLLVAWRFGKGPIR